MAFDNVSILFLLLSVDLYFDIATKSSFLCHLVETLLMVFQQRSGARHLFEPILSNNILFFFSTFLKIC